MSFQLFSSANKALAYNADVDAKSSVFYGPCRQYQTTNWRKTFCTTLRQLGSVRGKSTSEREKNWRICVLTEE